MYWSPYSYSKQKMALLHLISVKKIGFSFKLLLLGGFFMLLSAVSVMSAALEQSQPVTPIVRTAEVGGGVAWQSLSPAQRLALKPLEPRWASLPLDRQQKWLDVATRFARLSPRDQARVHARMTAWSKLTPEEHGQARLNFQEAKQLPSEDRQAKWNAYQSLSVDQKQTLAKRHREQSQGLSRESALAARRRHELDDPARGTHKFNLTPNPVHAPAPKPVGAALLRAAPGATTSLMSKRPKPPGHQQSGLPKISSTAEFVDPLTLLPQRGPQGAAVIRAAAASQAVKAPRR